MDDKGKLIRDYNRMCLSTEDCEDCELKIAGDCEDCRSWAMEHPSETVELIEGWAFENPIKTRQGEFLKLHPNARLDHDGVLYINPCVIDSTLGICQDGICTRGDNCIKCTRDYWSQEVE